MYQKLRARKQSAIKTICLYSSVAYGVDTNVFRRFSLSEMGDRVENQAQPSRPFQDRE